VPQDVVLVEYPFGQAEAGHVTHAPSEPVTPAEDAVYPEAHEVAYPISPQDFFVQPLFTHFSVSPQSLFDEHQPEIAEQV